MRGHEALIAMRMRRVRPRIVFVSAGRDPSELWRDWATETPHMAQVEVDDEDALSGLDFRFAVGLRAVVEGGSSQRVEKIALGLIQAGCRAVVAAVVAPQGVVSVQELHGERIA